LMRLTKIGTIPHTHVSRPCPCVVETDTEGLQNKSHTGRCMTTFLCDGRRSLQGVKKRGKGTKGARSLTNKTQVGGVHSVFTVHKRNEMVKSGVTSKSNKLFVGAQKERVKRQPKIFSRYRNRRCASISCANLR
jgi:hypothetical protein